MRVLFLILLLTTQAFSQASKSEEILHTHQQQAITRVGYGYDIQIEKRDPTDVYLIEIEDQHDEALSRLDERFITATMTSAEIETFLHDLELKQSKARQDYSKEQDQEAKKKLREALDIANRNRNAYVNNLWYTSILAPIYHRIEGPDKQWGNTLGEFWFNHFNVSRKSQRFHLPYRREIRDNTLTTFYNLLKLTAQHPAMLNYLDLRLSQKGRINENYAREVLELHTFGDENLENYSQEDIVKVANLLTGWTWKRETIGDLKPIVFHFNKARHDAREFTVFKNPNQITIKEGLSAARGESLLRHLANHPATKNNICKKLHKWFVGKYTKESLASCVRVWGLDGNLKEIYRDMFNPSNLSKNLIPKDRNPLEIIVARERLLKRPKSFNMLKQLRDEMVQMGLPYGDVPPPTGYKDFNKQASGSSIVTFIRNSFGRIKPSVEINHILLDGQVFDPVGKYLSFIGQENHPIKPLLEKAVYQAIVDKKTKKPDAFATFSYKFITSPSFLRK